MAAKSEKREKNVSKTVAMHLLDSAGVKYETRSYPWSEDDLSGVHAASVLGEDPARVFKTLVVRGICAGGRGAVGVFCIPVAENLDLKKCASLLSEKRAEMLPVSELQGLTGYLRGGCSPIGMKRRFPTFLHRSALDFPEGIFVSAGLRGRQILISPTALAEFLSAKIENLIQETK